MDAQVICKGERYVIIRTSSDICIAELVSPSPPPETISSSSTTCSTLCDMDATEQAEPTLGMVPPIVELLDRTLEMVLPIVLPIELPLEIFR
eukprot:11069498-Heterocapsa_arctica.AAC.1